mgnify:CR=1 FL=1
MREMKDSNVNWLNTIPCDWALSRIKYVLNERIEKNDPIKTKDILSLTAKQGVVPLSEKEGGGNKPKEDFTAYKLAYPNDIVINSMNILSGSVGLSKYFGCVSPVYYMLRPFNDNFDVRYFNYIFQTKVFQLSLFGLGNGILIKESGNGKFNTIRMRIPMEKFGNLLIPVPNEKEQIKISSFLDTKCSEIDATAEDIQKEISLLEDYKKSVITEAVTKGLNPDAEMKDSGIEWIGSIPENCIISKLKYIAILSPKCEKFQKLKGDYELTFTPMENIKNGFFVNESKHVTELANSLTRYQEGDIALAKVTPCFENGNICIMENLVNEVGMGSSELFIIRNHDAVLKKYLFYWLQNTKFVDEACKTMTGVGGLKRVSSVFLNNSEVLVFDYQTQQDIVNYLDTKCSEIDALIADKKRQLDIIAEYKKSLIYEYVTGKKEVPVNE